MPPLPPALARQVRRLVRERRVLEDGAAEYVTRLLQVARTQLRTRILSLDPGSTHAGVLRSLEGVVGETITRLQRGLLSRLLTDTERGLEIGIGIAEVGMPSGLQTLQFHVSDEIMQTLGHYEATHVQRITEELRSQLSVQIQLGILGGKSVPEVARDVLGTGIQPIGPFRTAKQRAEAIARTEMNRVSNLATQLRVNALGERSRGVEKEWLTAGDIRVRPTHRKLHGVRIPWDDAFNVGGEKAQFPLDPNLSAAETVHCRCTFFPVYPKEKAAEPPLSRDELRRVGLRAD